VIRRRRRPHTDTSNVLASLDRRGFALPRDTQWARLIPCGFLDGRCRVVRRPGGGPQPWRQRRAPSSAGDGEDLPPAGQNDPELYGAITEVGIAKAEVRAPRRRRVFCLAVTSEVGLGRGRPSSWSAAIDQLCYGGGDRRRLMVLAAGNLRGDIEVGDYLDRNDLEEVESPAQAWNPLVVAPTPTRSRSCIQTMRAGSRSPRRGICRPQAAHPEYGNASGRSVRTLSLRAATSPTTEPTQPRRSMTCN